MSRVVDHRDRLEPLPDISGVFDAWEGPWQLPVAHLPVDGERTRALIDWDHQVHIRSGGDLVPWFGIPFQFADGQPHQRIWEATRPGSWLPWAWNPFPSRNVRLPAVVRRYGDPTPAAWGDFQSFQIAVRDGTYTELSAFGPSWFNWPHPWRADNIAQFRLDRAWDAPGQPFGVGATGIPMVPLLPTYEELERGEVRHAMHLVVPHYSGERILAPARGTDGMTPGHPLYAGHRLRLRSGWQPPADATPHALALVQAAKTYGLIVSDKSTFQGPHARPIPFDHSNAGWVVRCPQDPRIDFGGISWNASDLRVVAA